MTEVVEQKLNNNTNLSINNGNNGVVKKSNKKINKRHKKKKNKNAELEIKPKEIEEDEVKDNEESNAEEIEYVSELPIDSDNPLFSQFSDVFSKFAISNNEEEDSNQESSYEMNISNKNKDDEDEEYNSEGESTPLSKKKLKKISRLSIAELKQLTKRPEVVEWVDATASDPGLLLTLKSHRNAVPVPAHWSQKRKYLQGKRGIEKPPFELPDFIKDTGIMEMRAAAKDKEDSSKLKTKARERMQPKMGKLDIDYQRLHDAFFRFQTKPRLTRHGELYFEGKEFEAKLKEKKPGQLSEELKAALNIPPLAPPPWLINMQRFGPPPSYPNLKIPGLNCPIPHGANWGYHPGGWGKPPVDENNRPLYGDVFGINQFDYNDNNAADVNKELWGQIVSDEEYEEEEEEEAEEEQEEAPAVEEAEFHQPPPPTQENIAEGYATPSGYSSVQTGLQTPEFVELRKGRKFEEEPKQLYHVLPEMQAPITGSFGSQHVYNMEALNESSSKEPRKRRRFDVDVSLDPSELENPEAVEAKYNQAKTQQTGGTNEDLSDLVAEENLKRNKKRQEKSSKASEKRRDFKF